MQNSDNIINKIKSAKAKVTLEMDTITLIDLIKLKDANGRFMYDHFSKTFLGIKVVKNLTSEKCLQLRYTFSDSSFRIERLGC